MAIRILLMLTISLSSMIFAQDLKSIYKNKNYSEYVNSFQSQYSDYRKARGNEIFMYAMSLSKTNKYQRSNKIFSYILKRYYKKDLIAFRKESEDDYSETFVAILHIMARNYLDSFMAHPDPKSQQAKKFEKTYLVYFESLEDFDQVDDDAITMMEEDYEDYLEEIKQRNYQWRYYAELGYSLFQTAPSLVEAATGTVTPLLANSTAYTIGGGARYENSKRAYFAAIHFATGSATVESQDSNLVYLQEGASVGSTIIEAGHLFKIAKGSGEIGASLFTVITSGEFAEPAGFTIEDKDIVSFGFSIDSYYNFNQNWGLGLRMGNAFSFESATWNFSLRYIF